MGGKNIELDLNAGILILILAVTDFGTIQSQCQWLVLILRIVVLNNY